MLGWDLGLQPINVKGCLPACSRQPPNRQRALDLRNNSSDDWKILPRSECILNPQDIYNLYLDDLWEWKKISLLNFFCYCVNNALAL